MKEARTCLPPTRDERDLYSKFRRKSFVELIVESTLTDVKAHLII